MESGKHQWRIVITAQGYTEYQFRSPPVRLRNFTYTEFTWHHYREWPGYDHNDTFDGLPRTLRKLWEVNRVTIERILHGKEPAQMELL
jgi:hypothetical protein